MFKALQNGRRRSPEALNRVVGQPVALAPSCRREHRRLLVRGYVVRPSAEARSKPMRIARVPLFREMSSLGAARAAV